MEFLRLEATHPQDEPGDGQASNHYGHHGYGGVSSISSAYSQNLSRQISMASQASRQSAGQLDPVALQQKLKQN